MNYYTCIFISSFAFILLSCDSKKNNTHTQTISVANIASSTEGNIHTPVMQPADVLNSFNDFWTYWSNEVFLTRDFIALNTDSTLIDRKSFLQKLTSGEYIPLKLYDKNDNLIYRLYKINHHKVNDEIRTVTKQYAADYYYPESKMEGLPLPDFSFKDINGNIYNRENCKGKIVVLNCWFIHCAACVSEMPDLNKLVKQYSGNQNIVFISLAPDNNQQLKKFLSKTKFDYAVVGNMENYLSNQLKITPYPRQIIIDREGKIFRFLDTYDDVNYELKKLMN